MQDPMPHHLRPYTPADAQAIDRLALAAFQQYRNHYDDWPEFARRIAAMSTLADTAEIIVAIVAGKLVGAVAYVAPGRPKAAFFEPEWAVLRTLVVDPAHRGQGIGRALTAECIHRARRDGATFVALHTSPMMQVALAIYQRMGFEFVRAVPPIHGVAYGVYGMPLRGTDGDEDAILST